MRATSSALQENLAAANRFSDWQLDPRTYTLSLERHGISPTGKEDWAVQMRAHVDEIVKQLPNRLAVFGENHFGSPKSLQLQIIDQSKICEGTWQLSVQGLDPDSRKQSSAQFRLQWSGEYARGYHLFVVSSSGEAGVIPTIVDASNIDRELAIFTIGKQIAGSPLCRN